MFRIADDFQLDKRAECSRAEGSDAGEKLRKTIVPPRRILFMTGPGKTLIVRDKANSKKEAYKRERTGKRERVGGGSRSRASVARKIEKHLYAGTNVTHPLGCSELRQ